MNQTDLSAKPADTAFREGSALLEGCDFGFFSITGKDAKNFLHRMLSNEIRNLAEGAGTETCLLSPKGRVELYFHLWRVDPGYRVIIWGKQREEFIPKLDRFLFTEEVKLENWSDRDRIVMLCGPAAGQAFERTLGTLLPEIEFNQSRMISNVPEARVYRCDWAPVPVYLLTLPAHNALEVEERFLKSGVVAGDWTTFHTLRIEKGTPWPEFEVDDSMIPYECGLDNTVSLTKGCFVGQEIVARMKNLGESPRHLRALVFEDSTVPPRGAEVQAGEIHAGRVLTSGYSEKLGVTIATSALLRKTSEPGASVTVGGQTAHVKLFPL